jgi:predicted RNA-binding Zn ribbon-like protein
MQIQSEKRTAERSPEELCIRFVNTVSGRRRDENEERLPTADALLRWFGENGLAGPEHLARLGESWQRDTRAAGEVYAAAVALREAIYGIVHAHIEGRDPPPQHLALLNTWLARPAPGVELAAGGGVLGWRPSSPDADPRDLLRPIALSAAELMTGPRAQKVRQCADDRGCGWLFVDESRAQNRRWCAMGDCGNRAKAARHRVRKRQAAKSFAASPG